MEGASVLEGLDRSAGGDVLSQDLDDPKLSRASGMSPCPRSHVLARKVPCLDLVVWVVAQRLEDGAPPVIPKVVVAKTTGMRTMMRSVISKGAGVCGSALERGEGLVLLEGLREREDA